MSGITISDRGALVYNGMVIGRVEGGGDTSDNLTITLNAGWCSEAGVDIRVLADPEVDRKRDGVLLDRPAR